MRPVMLGQPGTGDPKAWKTWIEQCFREIENASQEDISAIANDFSVTNYTATRTLNGGTATLADVANVLCTFISDLQNRGMKRSQ